MKPQRRKGSHFTLPNSTVSSEDPVHYRHFAVDVSNDIIYMCDMNPYRPLDRSACWVSKDQGALWIRKFPYCYTKQNLTVRSVQSNQSTFATLSATVPSQAECTSR